MIAAAALLLAAGQSIVGQYQSHQTEIGAALELRSDGHFRYQLDYGAVSEIAEGDWTSVGDSVLLTTRPAPKTPSFELVRDEPAPSGKLFMVLEPPGFGEAYSLDAIGTDDTGAKGLVTTNSDGEVEAGGHKLVAVDPMVPVFGTVAGHFPLVPGRGHRLTLRFHSNDLGIANFKGEPLRLTTGALVLNRYDTEIRFVRVRP